LAAVADFLAETCRVAPAGAAEGWMASLST
jgi:hypothetical protein